MQHRGGVAPPCRRRRNSFSPSPFCCSAQQPLPLRRGQDGNKAGARRCGAHPLAAGDLAVRGGPHGRGGARQSAAVAGYACRGGAARAWVGRASGGVDRVGALRQVGHSGKHLALGEFCFSRSEYKLIENGVLSKEIRAKYGRAYGSTG
jgi:hypothetical protein